ncbi:MAG TPA: type II CAAX endopeptidase family protein [Bryobacteraceae bacterium]|nr:type II CAAX endopeptidase family protein [Bryobacteraceae bacterium]
MNSEQPFEPLGMPPRPEPPGRPVAAPAPPEAPAPPPREPFWGYSDVLVFVGLLLAAAVVSLGGAAAIFSFLPARDQSQVAEALIAQSLIYVLAYGALAVLFHIHYDRPFWSSMGWKSLKIPAPVIVLAGAGTAIAVAYIGVLIRTPTTSNRITEMLENPRTLIWVALFGLTLAPVAEELGFRGLLQPLLVRSFGPAPGILGAAIPFGLLHFSEYGNSWRHALLISMAGAAFGWMRYRTGSTKASALMHASYNALEFVAFISQQKEFHHP